MFIKVFALLTATTVAQLQSSPAFAAPLQLEGVDGFEILPETCSFTTIYDKLGQYWPAGQIEGVSYTSLKVDTLRARVAAYLKTPEQQAEFDSWIAQHEPKDLRMRAKDVRFNQWGGQGADEWVMFCSKSESSIYLLQRNVWVE